MIETLMYMVMGAVSLMIIVVILEIVEEDKGIKKCPKCGEWIPCSERLPEDSRSVLIYTKEGRVAEGCYNQEGLEWWQFRWSVRNPHVIAWMPLPEPYEKGEEHEII